MAASAGSACHEGGETASPVLLAMGVDPSEGLGAVRLSLGRQTTEPDIATATKVLVNAWQDVSSGIS